MAEKTTRELTLPAPSAKQREFLSDRHKYVAFGGARGGGKSWAVRVQAVLLCLKYPGIKVMIVRKTYPELNENHIIPLCELLRCRASDRRERFAEYNDAKKHIVFGNGSRILFRYCDTDADAQRFQGTEVDALFVDEATQQSEARIQRLTACVRGVNAFPKLVRYTCNPGGEGHEWVRRLFIDRRFREGEEPAEYSFIQALVSDNQALMRADPDYVNQLRALPPKLREAWLNGSWDLFEGQFFDDFVTAPPALRARELGLSQEELRRERRYTHVIEPFDISKGECRGWSVMRSYDFGYNRPFSLGYWAMDYDGVLYRILEIYGCTGTPNEGLRWSPERQFRYFSQFEREHPWLRGRQITGSVADPSIWDASRGESIADTAARCGIYFTPGDNKRIPGWMQLHYRLQFDERGCARMYVFDNCREFIRTLPALLYSSHDGEDLDSSLEDHAADEARYMCMSRPVKPIAPRTETPLAIDPLGRVRG